MYIKYKDTKILKVRSIKGWYITISLHLSKKGDKVLNSRNITRC